MDPLIIGIGDLHGHYPALQAILERCDKEYGIFSREARLRPGVQIVFTGDYIDRGTQNLDVIHMIKVLQYHNPSVKTLFGNHELLALSALNRARGIEGRIKDDPAYQRPWTEADWTKDALAEYASVFFGNSHGRNGGTTFIQEFGPTPAAAFSSYVQRMARDGDVGKWMRNLKPLVVETIGERKILFVHGGIPPSLRDPVALEEYAAEVDAHIEMRTSDAGGNTEKYLNNGLVGNHSVFWDRSMPRSDPQEAIDAARRRGVDHIVIGHTPQKRIASFGGAVFDIDVGMTPRYGEGEPACIVFKQDGIHALYARQGERRLVYWD